MGDEILTSENIKEILQKAVQNKNECGFAAYIALNEKLTSTFSLFCSTLGTGGGS